MGKFAYDSAVGGGHLFFPLLLALLVAAAAMVTGGRPLQYSGDGGYASDGVHVGEKQAVLQQYPQGLIQWLIKGKKEGGTSTYNCEQMYGFLPCSNTAPGHLFLIVVYEYLLFHGERYVMAGGHRMFDMLGPGVFGATAFHLLDALPESFILLASGLLNSKETAQEYVITGVALLAGSTILLLTLIWGTCVIVASRQLPTSFGPYSPLGPHPLQNPFQKLLSLMSGFGVSTDLETSYMARIMVVSVIPFIIIQIPQVFRLSSSGERIVIISTLVVSVLLLLLYFIYQIFQPWIQNRRLEYVKHEHLVLDILEQFQKHTLGRLLTDGGAPNVPAIRRLFEEIDQDGDNYVSFSELQKSLGEISFRKPYLDKDKTIAKVMEEFDVDGDEKINMNEFVSRFINWLNETKKAVGKRCFSRKSLQEIYQSFQPWFQSVRKEHEMKMTLTSEILKHVQSYALGSFFTEDGSPDVPAIKRLFEKIDLDGDSFISGNELKQLILDIKFGKMPLDADEAVACIMDELDVNGDQMITEDEFITGFMKWLSSSSSTQTPPNSAEFQDDTNEATLKESKILGDERGVDKSPLAWMKAILLTMLGIAILGVLAEPLIYSVQHFSKAADVPSFLVSFILVPLATNARAATSAITSASHKKLRTTSLTFSEIYGGVFMNNILGISVLLSLVYFRGLSWDFSAEVLIALIVCAIVGLTASFTSIFPLCTSLLAFLLYPLSLLLVYVFSDVFRES